jgi:Protein of unknown function (DUF1553)/Protein of unknown function (DUF1549)
MASHRRIFKSLLLLSVIVFGIAIALSALRSRSKIRPDSVKVQDFSTLDLRHVVDRANDDIEKLIDAAKLPTSTQADNLTLARRISLGLVGNGLSLEEIRAFESVPEAQQIEWLTNYLLQDRRWSDYFAERFSRAMVGTDEGPFLLFRRRRFNAWLSEKLHQGIGYDQIVREVIASEGLWTDTPQVNFLTASMSEENQRKCNAIVLAGRTSRTFLAQRIDCLQCHDDFVDQHNFGSPDEPIPGAQTHFHQLAAFYGTTGLLDNPFSGIRDIGGEYKTKLLGDEEEETIDPKVPFSQELLPDKGKPRQRLADWVTHKDNKAFSRATVNRVWALLFSRPLVDPVDSIPLDDSVPQIMESLAQDFAKHHFDIRRLIRVIVSLDAFQRDSRADFEVTADHEAAYAVFPITQLRPEQVSGCMIQASKLSAINADSSVFVRLARFGATNDFLRDFGDRGIDEFQSDAITISQRLVMMNGQLVADRTKEDIVANASTRIAQMVSDNDKAIKIIFLSVLGRYPSSNECEQLKAHLHEKFGSERARAVDDIYWAMLNSTEFVWNH